MSDRDRLADYRRKRDFGATPEPVARSAMPRVRAADAALPRFVVQEHHARRLHWDLRLEHDGRAGLVGGARRASRPTRAATTWPCAPRTTRSSTSTSTARSRRATTARAA